MVLSAEETYISASALDNTRRRKTFIITTPIARRGRETEKGEGTEGGWVVKEGEMEKFQFSSLQHDS